MTAARADLTPGGHRGTTGDPHGTPDGPHGTPGGPRGTTGDHHGTPGGHRGTTGDHHGTPGGPHGTTGDPHGTTGDPHGTPDGHPDPTPRGHRVTPGGSGPRPGGHHGRGWIAALIAAATVAGLVVLAITKLDPNVIAHALAHVKAGWTLVALALMAAAFLARAESWHAVLRAAIRSRRGRAADLGSDLDRGTVTRALLIGMAGSSVAPGRLGEAARAWVVARRLGQPSRSFALVLGTVVSQTFLNLLALAILAIVAVLDSALAKARVEAIAAAVVLPAVLIAVIFLAPPLLRRACSVRIRACRKTAAWLEAQLVRGREGLAVFRSPLAAIHATGAQLGAWALQLGACYATILALGLQHHANLAAAAAVLLVVNLTAIVPLTPSNVGVFQAACIAVLHPFGVDASRALAYGLVLQAVEIFDALILGGPALLREGLRWGELRRHAWGRLEGAGTVRRIPARG